MKAKLPTGIPPYSFLLILVALLSSCNSGSQKAVQYMPESSDIPQGYGLVNEEKHRQSGHDVAEANYFSTDVYVADGTPLALSFLGDVNESGEIDAATLSGCRDAIETWQKSIWEKGGGITLTPMPLASPIPNVDDYRSYAGKNSEIAVSAACFVRNNFTGIVVLAYLHAPDNPEEDLIKFAQLMTKNLPPNVSNP